MAMITMIEGADVDSVEGSEAIEERDLSPTRDIGGV